jgi:hypothetical protein
MIWYSISYKLRRGKLLDHSAIIMKYWEDFTGTCLEIEKLKEGFCVFQKNAAMCLSGGLQFQESHFFKW